jgi:EmrB/QacA subfamily drug resistance transporter
MTVVRTPCDEAVIRSQRCRQPVSRAVGRVVLVVTILGTALVFIDGTVANLVLPALQRDLGASLVQAQWVVEAYTLFLSALMLVGGALGDRFGRRRIFGVGVVTFALASLGCALTPTMGVLIAARALQGVGGALLTPGSLALIGSVFSEGERGRAIGTWSGWSGIATAAGPLLGGWLIDRVSWRWAFAINVPVAIVVLLLLHSRVPESRGEPAAGGLDLAGAALGTIGLGGIVYGLIESSRLGLRHPLVLGALVTGLVAFVAFRAVEARAVSPMVPLDLFRSPAFTGANLTTLFVYAGLGGAMFFVPLTLIQVQGASATRAGAAFLPFILVVFTLSRWAGRMVDRAGARRPLIAGPLIAALGFSLLALFGGHSYYLGILAGMTVLGAGMGITIAPLTTTVLDAVDARQAGIASGINNVVARAAGLLAIALLGLLLIAVFSRSLHHALSSLHLPADLQASIEAERMQLATIRLPADLDGTLRSRTQAALRASFLDGFRVVLLSCAGLAAAGALAAAALIRRRGP